jgi:hypothetical protein
MGDRCHCSLVLYTPLHGVAAAELAEALSDCHRAYTILDIDQELTRDGYLSFNEVNYAQMDEPVREVLKRHAISYGWWNEAGCEYGEGVGLCAVFPGFGKKVDTSGNCRWTGLSDRDSVFLSGQGDTAWRISRGFGTLKNG